MKIITFTGSMGSGKSTAVSLVNELSKSRWTSQNVVKNVKFADPLYDMQNFIYKRISSIYSPPKEWIKDRKLLQWLGTEWGRSHISDTLWVDLWKDQVKELRLQGTELVTCDDVRFENEAKIVKELKGLVIKLTCSKAEARIDTKTGISNHPSESGLSNEFVDYIIENDGTVEDLMSSLLTVNERHGIW